MTRPNPSRRRRLLLAATETGLSEIGLVVVLLIAMPLALLLVVAGFTYGGVPGGVVLLAGLGVLAAWLLWRSRRG